MRKSFLTFMLTLLTGVLFAQQPTRVNVAEGTLEGLNESGIKTFKGIPFCSTSRGRFAMESTSACREMAGRAPSQGVRSQPYAGEYLRRHELRHEEDERRLSVS